MARSKEEDWPPYCGEVSNCPWSGYWGATGVMPPEHFWFEHEHGGYLAHYPPGYIPDNIILGEE